MALFDRFRGRNRVENIERRFADIENEARKRIGEERKRIEEEEKEARIRQRTEELRNQQATSRGWSTFPSTILLENVKKPHFLVGALLVFILLVALWYFNFLHIREALTGYGFTILGLISVFVMICLIIYGWSASKRNIANFFIATALFIWMLDLVPENVWLIGPWLGPEWAGYAPPIDAGVWKLSLLSVFFSGIFFSMLYINMILNIIEKEWIVAAFIFFFIIITNHFFNFIATSFPYLNISFIIPLGKIGYTILVLGVLGFLGWGAWELDKNKRVAFPEFFASLYMYFVFSFFLVNNGWRGNIRAWLHAGFILLFGFMYMKIREENKSARYFFIPTLLIIDFFGYGLLYSSGILALQFVPPLVIFVIFYCYEKEAKYGEKNYTYPVAAFALLVTFILIMSINVMGFQESSALPYVAKKGATFKELYGTFAGNLKEAIEGRLDIATGGLYRGNVEKNRYESLGVYFGNLRAADPRFYDSEPITVWGNIRSKTYKDAVVINFSCYRWKDNKKIRADKIIPDIKFPIFTLEEVDTECVFYPSTEPKIQPGANAITFSAEYNFGTDAYLKTYFIDRDRFRAYARESPEKDVDAVIFREFGIKETKPASVSTNGPVEIGMGTGNPLITVSEGYTIKPSIGITLTNRQEIQDKDKKIITRWEGKIKNITELVLLAPPGITLENIDSCKSDNAAEKLKCPCNVPFKEYKLHDCLTSCSQQVIYPCDEACKASSTINKELKEESYKKCYGECEATFDKCNEECNFLFQTDEGEGSSSGKYTGYSLDVGSLEFKDLNNDIDKHRSFLCRFTPSQSVLDAAPITTKYFRARARYNYLLENSVPVNVESTPVQQITTVPDALFKIAAEIEPGSDLWFEGLTPELISAIASVESSFKHCCEEMQGKGTKCTSTNNKLCDFDKLYTSGTSYGIMQIKYNTEKTKAEVNKLIDRYCAVKNIADYDCNVMIGLAILKAKYNLFMNGCKETYEYRTKDMKKYPTLINACDSCTSTRDGTPYSSYTKYKAALRGYNGYGCDYRYDREYVEKVEEAMKSVKGTEVINPSILRGISRGGEGMADGTSIESASASQAPLPPIGPLAYDTPNTRDSITVSWGSSPTPNVRYLVYRYEQQTGESRNLYDGAETIYVDAGVKEGVGYYYKITAYNDFEESDAALTNVVKSTDN